jgi:hypothetical protein
LIASEDVGRPTVPSRDAAAAAAADAAKLLPSLLSRIEPEPLRDLEENGDSSDAVMLDGLRWLRGAVL